jgi:hypothetical protein
MVLLNLALLKRRPSRRNLIRMIPKRKPLVRDYEFSAFSEPRDEQ